MAMIFGEAGRTFPRTKPFQAHESGEGLIEILFSAGLVLNKPPHMLEAGELRKAENIYYPKETMFPRTRGGLVQYMTGTAAPGKVTGVYIYVKDSSTSFVVFSCLDSGGTDQELYYLDGSLAKVQIASSLGSTNPPSFLTYNSRLLIAVGGGQPIKFWNGETSGSNAAASGTITFGSACADGDTVTVGARTYTAKTAGRAQPGEFTGGVSANADAAALEAAIDTDSYDVSASVSTNVVTVTATSKGTAGNSLELSETGSSMTVSGANLSGGTLGGPELESIETYQHLHPSILALDKKDRVVAAGDNTYPYRLGLSAPLNEMSWAYGDYGDAEYIDIGYNDGNFFSAVVPYRDEIFIHKSGQNKEIYRLQVVDPNPATWSVLRRHYTLAAAALNHRSALSVADSHITLDSKAFRVFKGSDSYDEIRSGEAGARIAPLVTSTNAAQAFMVQNPLEQYTLIFPAAGKNAACFHYGSERWTEWKFMERDISAGAYDEANDLMLLGADDGFIYKIDNNTYTDDDTGYSTVVRAGMIGGRDMWKLLVKGSLLFYQALSAGNCTLEAIVERDTSNPKLIKTFTVDTSALTLYGATMDLNDATMYFTDEDFNSQYSAQIVPGNLIAPQITLASGGMVIHSLLQQVAITGRAYK